MGIFFSFSFWNMKGGNIMLMEVYYEHYLEKSKGGYQDEEISMPYGVRIYDYELREGFSAFLKSEGFKCVNWNSTYPVILVNMELKRFGLIYLPCKHSSVNDRLYTLKEFLSEVYFT